MRTLLLALLLALPIAPALAQTAKPKAAAVDARLMAEFKASDIDRNGTLDRGEVDARVARMAAGSNRFTPTQAKQLSGLWFTRADADRNGRITPAEMQALLRATARRYDANGDGVVSIAERTSARQAVEAEAKGR